MAKKKRGVAISELARMVQKGFAASSEEMWAFQGETMERFEGIDRRLEVLKKVGIAK